MIKEIKMPAGGQTTDVSVVGTWLVKCGDKVKRGDALLEIETDKATLTVESFAKGTVLALLVSEGDRAAAGEVIALIGDESDREEADKRLSGDGTVQAQSPKAGEGLTRENLAGGTWTKEIQTGEGRTRESRTGEPKTEKASPGPTRTGDTEWEEEYQPIDKNAPRRMKTDRYGRSTSADGSAQTAPGPSAQAAPGAPARTELKPADIKAMPNAKLLAKENHISLTDVAKAAGKTILKRQDVRAFLEQRSLEDAQAGKLPENSPVTDNPAESRETRIPFTNMRRIIARRMLESAQNIPVFTATVEIDMTQCISLRKQINSGKDDRKVSYNDILFKCIEAALRAWPYVNASCAEEEIILHRDVNIGLAVSIDGGLVVPVVHKVGEKSITQISARNRENVRKAREGKLLPQDMSGGTITLSNLGIYPVTQFTAIINPPESCILAVGAMEEKPVLTDGTWKAVPVMKLTGSFDHRIIDGAYGAGFLSELKKMIENPALALV